MCVCIHLKESVIVCICAFYKVERGIEVYCMCVFVLLCVCECVCFKQKEREKKRDGECIIIC